MKELLRESVVNHIQSIRRKSSTIPKQSLLKSLMRVMFEMSITAAELKENLNKYLILASTEDVFITQYGKIVAKLTNPYLDRVAIAESLLGILPQTTTFEEAMEERLNEI